MGGLIPETRVVETRRVARRTQVDAQPRPRLEACHTLGRVLLPDRLALLDRLPKNAVAAEIGVAQGDFSAEILARTQPRRLHLIDAWETERYSPGEAKVRRRFSREVASGQVRINRGLSTDVLGQFPPGHFDWVYLDTSHTYSTTAAELALCDGLIGAEGFIAGHDFCTGNVVKPVVYGVVAAVNEFCVTHRWRYDAITLESHGHFSFCLRRLSATSPGIEDRHPRG